MYDKSAHFAVLSPNSLCLDYFSDSNKMEVWKPASWKTAKKGTHPKAAFNPSEIMF